MEFAATRALTADSDLCSLPDGPDLDARIVDRLASRLIAGTMFTTIGATMITVNPYKRLGDFSDAVANQYRSSQGASMLLSPHLYKVAAVALRESTRISQSICITGESGSGKTESARYITSWLAGGAVSAKAVASRVVNSNLLLEAFGNARTDRNDNSSRFAKLTTFALSPAGVIVAAQVSTYLLDKSKVTARESPFHMIRYLNAAPPNVKASLRLTSRAASGAATALAADAAAYRGLLACMKDLGIPADDSTRIFSAVALSRNLLDIEFAEAEDGLRAVPSAALDAVAATLDASPDAIATALLKRQVIVRNNSPLLHDNSLGEALEARDSAAQLVYCAVFERVVALINTSLLPQSGTPVDSFTRRISLVDIFGFESDNSTGNFSALAINFANEVLQQVYQDTSLRAELAMYETEGVPFTAAVVASNADVLAAFEGRPGLWSLLDDGARLGMDASAKDESDLHETLARRLSKVAALSVLQDGKHSFVISHFASDVVYSVDGTTRANASRVPALFCGLLRNAPQLTGSLVLPDDNVAGKATRSVSATFRDSLASLVNTLTTGEIQWIRSILPNRTQAAVTVDTAVLAAQVRYLGIGTIRRVVGGGWAFHCPIQEFFDRYRVVSKSTWAHGVPAVGDPRDTVIALLSASYVPGGAARDGAGPQSRALKLSLHAGVHACDLPACGSRLAATEYAVGRTMVFLKSAKTLEGFEHARAMSLWNVTTRLQICWRSAACRAKLHAALLSFARLRAIARGRKVRAYVRQLRTATLRVQAITRGRVVRATHTVEREALGLIRGASGKPRRQSSLHWAPLSGVGGFGRVDAKLLPAAAGTIVVWSDDIVKIRLRGGASAPVLSRRQLVLTKTHLVSLSSGGAVKTLIPLADIAGVCTSPFADGLFTLFCPARGRDFSAFTDAKSSLLEAFALIFRVANTDADETASSASGSPPPLLHAPDRSRPPRKLLCAAAWDISCKGSPPRTPIVVQELPLGHEADRALISAHAKGDVIPRVGGPQNGAAELPSRILVDKGGVRVLVPGRAPRKPLRELLSPAELVAATAIMRGRWPPQPTAARAAVPAVSAGQ